MTDGSRVPRPASYRPLHDRCSRSSGANPAVATRRSGLPPSLVAYLGHDQASGSRSLYPAFVLAVTAVSRRRLRELWVTGVVAGLALAQVRRSWSRVVRLHSATTLSSGAHTISTASRGCVRLPTPRRPRALYLRLHPADRILPAAICGLLSQGASRRSAAHRAFLCVVFVSRPPCSRCSSRRCSLPHRSVRGACMTVMSSTSCRCGAIVGAVWLQEGAPRPRRAVGLGAALLLRPLRTSPVRRLCRRRCVEGGLHAAGTRQSGRTAGRPRCHAWADGSPAPI